MLFRCQTLKSLGIKGLRMNPLFCSWKFYQCSSFLHSPLSRNAGFLSPSGRHLTATVKAYPALFPARRSAPCTDPEDTAPVAPAGLFTVYFDYKIALFFVKEVFACCGTGILGCYESGTAKRFSLALQFLQGEASCSERAFASLSG